MSNLQVVTVALIRILQKISADFVYSDDLYWLDFCFPLGDWSSTGSQRERQCRLSRFSKHII